MLSPWLEGDICKHLLTSFCLLALGVTMVSHSHTIDSAGCPVSAGKTQCHANIQPKRD